jgi:CheY-like chemotaxis protein
LARKILLADDSVTAQNMGRKILSDAGYDVVLVNNGSAALKKVAELKPDLIVLDVYMPGYSGLEVCQRLKDSPDTERIPVLLTVGKLEPFKSEEARRVRADAYIIKPFEASELLSAMARMEDRMVPGQGAGSPFGDVGGKKSEGGGDPDTGWKSRLRFPSKKKKEEPEPETELVGGPSFRNFRSGKSKAPAAAAEKTIPAPVELSVVPDIPRDITPEELDALSALAAKLDGVAPAAEESVTPVVEKALPIETEAELEAAAPAVEVAADAAVSNAMEHNAAVVAPAPVDREDEPIFATAASAVEPVQQEEKIEVKEVPVISGETTAGVSPAGTTEAQAKSEEQKPDEPKVEKAPKVVEEIKTEEAPQAAENAPKPEETPRREEIGEAVPVAAAVAQVGSAPSEAELEEALRLLTPAMGHADQSPMPTREALVAAGAVLAEEAARNAAVAPRWVAAAVSVSPEEAAVSLEEEMFRTLVGATVVSSESGAPVTTTAASPAAVEKEATAEVQVAAEVQAEILAETPAETISAVAAADTVTAAASVEAVQAEQQDSQTKVAEEVAEGPQAATFADVAQHDEVELGSAKPSAEPGSDAAVPADEVQLPVVETMEVPTSEAVAGGEEAMAKQRAKTGTSNWHQIRTGSAAAGLEDIVEAAKQAEPAAKEAPKTMAAAAAAESAPPAAGLPDPNVIASIVDSVLADLRPKIVEEIAKKLAGK